MIKKLVILAALSVAAFGQAQPVNRVKSYAAVPTAGDCTAAAIGVLTGINTVPDPDTIYDCVTVATVPTWQLRATTGTVTSVAQSFTGGLIAVAGSPITTSGTLALTVAGTSGGIPFFNSATTWATSTAPVAGQLMVWGGAAAAPTGIASTTYQPLDADLTDIAALVGTRGNLIRRGVAAWENVALGAVGGLLASDGTDAVWLARVSTTGIVDFAAMPDGSCLESAFALTGAGLGDAMAFGASVALPAGVSGTARVSALNTAQIQVCNLSGAAVDLASTTFTARVVR